MRLSSPSYPRNPYSRRARIIRAAQYAGIAAAFFLIGMYAAFIL